jgi:hypothetical protein
MTAESRPVASISLPTQGQTPAVLAEKPTEADKSRFLVPLWSRVSTIGRSVLSAIRRGWRRFLALTRLSSTAVCEESASLGCYDYHNYADDVDAPPWYTEGGAQCKRCGKRFRL